MISTRILSRIEDAPQAPWDQLARNHFYLSTPWLRSLEASRAGPEQARYFTAWQDSRLVGIATGLICQRGAGVRSLDHTLLGKLAPTTSKLGWSFHPALVMCSPEGRGEPFLLLDEQLGDEQGPAAMRHLLQAIEEEGRRLRVSVCFREIPATATGLISALQARGYRQTVSMPVNHLDVRWDSFEGYRQDRAIITAKMRSNINRHRKRNRSEGVSIFAIESDAQWDALGAGAELLIIRSYSGYNDDFPLRPGFLEIFRDTLGSNLIIYVAVKNDTLVGASLVYRRGDARHCKLVGVDHEATGDDFTYFNLVYYQNIIDAIADGTRRIYYGVAMYSVKHRFGCTMADSLILYKPRKAVLGPAIASWFRLHRRWYERKFALDELLRSNR